MFMLLIKFAAAIEFVLVMITRCMAIMTLMLPTFSLGFLIYLVLWSL